MNYGFEKYFQVSDILSALAWLIFLLLVVIFQSYRLKSPKLARLYRQNFYFKILFALIFSLYYIVIVVGGDTLAFWDGAKCIQNLILQDPLKAVEHLFTKSSSANLNYFFNSETGFPPGWIYRDPQSHFISKIAAIIGLLTFKSYLATSFIFAYLFARANWKMYLVAQQTRLFKSNLLPYAVLFIPSVSFWCSGLTKDTVIILAFFNIFYHFYYIFKKDEMKSIRRWALVLFYCFLILQIRGFLLVAILLPLVVALFKKLNKTLNLAPVFRLPLNIVLFSASLGATVAFMSSSEGSKIIMNNSALQEAMLTQNDFSNNETYGKNKYSLGKIDNSPFGIIKAMPISIFAGIYEPLPWKGLSVSLLLNALESAVLIFLTLQLFFSGTFIRWAKYINENEILIFCLVFVLIMAFVSGFTAIIYGVLVRFRAPLLPFWFALLIADFGSLKNPKRLKNEATLMKDN